MKSLCHPRLHHTGGMSLINFALTNTYAGQPGRTETTRVGFGREGGKLDYVERTSAGSIDAVPVTPAIAEAADGVRNALTGAALLDSVVVHRVGTKPQSVDWSYRNGPAASARFEAAPSNVRDVVAAMDALLVTIPAA